ncbi:MAG: SUMF1/EgtB/PvdO family nonheme iron enzyme [Planctomycetota bacterium]|nr:SUMF1/EgtB/PvdO family nonheme iron enzyme [Planctomycetota bacterium]
MEREQSWARRGATPLLAFSVSLLLCGVLLTSCGESSVEQERALARLERLVFVPEAVCVLGTSGLPTRSGLDCSNSHSLLVDRYEVTRLEWMDYLSRQVTPVDSAGEAHWAAWGSAGATLPATFMSLAEANDFAESEGMRVPSEREWLRISAGTRGQRWPWGTSSVRSVANTMDLGLHAALGVGTFEAGASPSGVYDLVGNAREWTVPGQASLDGMTQAMGGSWLSRQRALFDWSTQQGLTTSSLELGVSHRAVDVGVRLVADASTFLESESSKWGADPAARARVRAVGRRWGPAAVELLKLELGEGSDGIAWLLEGAER